MAIQEDPASVLDQWLHDVANLPAEISHLYEEMQAKEQQIQDCKNVIAGRDNSLQKFIKLNGSLVVNPKEEPYKKVIRENYDKAIVLQNEKVALAERAQALFDRHVKRLDIKIRDLQNDGSMAIDPQLPTLLRESMGNLVPPLSATNTGANTPLNPLSGNTGGGSSIANAAIARIVSATSGAGRANPPALQNMQTQALLNQQRLANAQTASQAAARQEREMSASSDTKRRRLNASLGALPPAPSSLARQSSLGPGTPKPSTPGGSRAGSAGPRPQKRALTIKKANPQQPLRKQLGNKAGLSKKSRRRLNGGSRASPSTTADDESGRSEGGTEDEEMTGVGHDGAADADDDEGDDTKYCFCQSVSYGDMVACDNENCKYQWFHWDCVNIKEEPVGDWLCPECSKPGTKVKRAR
ncbi:uncharacterized protein BDZ99DRAFT_528166 [Mytilinidion resinicola]|uniref:Chromatin modification-related protein n=1 Tax=Mytilinidion resinicola TaxID=574789 RepID=A0A6A6Y0E7_9PEZI|nr:uncharacterized protein BDZ99DRAFT_528166 [Mytilinidion resinicola]KAF2801695.1 hypothetical protein BDZ99DRAFT_528166 [Mytilinidion resinicola]